MSGSKEIAIKFANWLREVDTQERATEWFGFSDSDMFDHFMKLVDSSAIEEKLNRYVEIKTITFDM